MPLYGMCSRQVDWMQRYVRVRSRSSALCRALLIRAAVFWGDLLMNSKYLYLDNKGQQ